MKLWILFWLTLGAATCARYRPRRAVHVFFMHHEPSQNQSKPDISLYRHHPFRSFYENLFNFLDDSLGFDDYDLEKNSIHQDPWVHFIDKSNISKLNDKDTSSLEDNKTGNGTITDEFNFTTANGTEGFNLTTAPRDNHLIAIHSRVIFGIVKLDSNKTLNGTHANTTDSNQHLNGTNTVTYDLASTNSSGNIIDDNNNITREYRIKRIRRDSTTLSNDTTVNSTKELPVTETADQVNSTVSLNETIHFTKENQTHTEPNTTTDSVPVINFSREIDDDFTTSVERMIAFIDKQLENKSQAILKRTKRVDKVNISTALDITTIGVQSSPESSSDKPETSTSLREATVSIVRVNATTVNSTNLPTSGKTEVTSEDSRNVTTLVSKVTETTPRTNETFEVPDGMANENSDKIKELFRDIATSNAPTEPQEERFREKGLKEHVRKMYPGGDRISADSIQDIERMTHRAGKEKNQNEAFMRALVIPIFLVILMGSLLFAMHNMSRYFVQRTNTRLSEATTVGRAEVVQTQMTTMTSPMEENTTAMPENAGTKVDPPPTTEP